MMFAANARSIVVVCAPPKCADMIMATDPHITCPVGDTLNRPNQQWLMNALK